MNANSPNGSEPREANGKSGVETATALGMSQGQPSRIESAQRTASFLNATLMMGLYSVPPATRDEILGLVKPSGEDEHGEPAGCWVRPHPGLPHEIAPTVVFACREASSITWYQPRGLPLMLTPEFSQDGFGHAGNDAERAKWSHARQVYQTMLSSSGDQNVLFYLHETALRALAPGENSSDHGPLTNLTTLMWRERPRIRIVPADVPALGAFTLLRFADFGPAVCVPCGAATLIQEGGQVKAYEHRLALLDKTALSEQDSRNLIVPLVNGAGSTTEVMPEFSA